MRPDDEWPDVTDPDEPDLPDGYEAPLTPQGEL